jgi:hypothetical protein
VTKAAVARIGAACLVCAIGLPRAAGSIQVGLDPSAVAEAVRLARSSDAAALDSFHAGYRLLIDDPVVRRIDVLTEFRRVVQLTEEREGLRDATWNATRAESAARAFRGLLELQVFLQFSPKNTYRTMPAYSVVLYDRSRAAIVPIDSRTTQAYVGAQPAPPGTPILAGTLTATFDATRLDPSGRYVAGIFLEGREVRRLEVDLASLR